MIANNKGQPVDPEIVEFFIKSIIDRARTEPVDLQGLIVTEIPNSFSTSSLPTSAPEDIAASMPSDSSGCDFFNTLISSLSCACMTIAVAIADVHPLKKLFASLFFISFLLFVVSAVKPAGVTTEG